MRVGKSRLVQRSLLLVAVLVLGASGAWASPNGSGTEKVVLCHIPPGNPDNPQTIEVGQPAVEAHLAHGDAIGACGASQAVVSGAVFELSSNQPVPGATVTITFLTSGFQSTTEADQDGLFTFAGVPVDGAFLLEAADPSGSEAGTAEGAIDAGNLEASVLVVIDQPGPGSLSGTVRGTGGLPAPGALVTYLFPETHRTGSVATGADGFYSFTGLQTDGTVIVVAFDPATALSASSSTFVVPGLPNRILDLTLSGPSTVQNGLVNGDFADGLAGWETTGPTTIVPREELFGSQNPDALTSGSSAGGVSTGSSLVGAEDSCPVIRSAVISSAGPNNGVGQLTQSFVVPPGYGVLAGRVKFLSNEWPEFFGTQFNDTFIARLTTPSGATILASGNVNSSSWSAGALGFNGQAPEINFSIDISGFVGKTLNLYFDVRDVADLLFDSGLAITDVRLVRTDQYVQDGVGALTGPDDIHAQLGQGVRITFRNSNILGTTVTVRDTSPFGETKQSIILPLGSVTFTFSRFGEEPMSWDFSVDTFSDVFVVTYSIESTWVPGMPPNPCY